VVLLYTNLAMMFFMFVSAWPGVGGSLTSCTDSRSLESISGESMPEPRSCRSHCCSACSNFSFKCSTYFSNRSISCLYCKQTKLSFIFNSVLS
jgi:hypothetical protein